MEKVKVTERDVKKIHTKNKNVIFNTPFRRLPSVPERSGKRSNTVPDQALSIQQILKRYASGQSLPELNDGYFDEDIPDLKNLSVLEREELRRETAESIKKTRDDLASSQKMAEIQKNKDKEATASDKKEQPQTEDQKSESEAKTK